MKNICIVSECQQILGVGGTETVSYLLKEELKKNGYSVWSVFYVATRELCSEDILLPDKQDICSSRNRNSLINTILDKNIDIILLQGAPVKGLLELCVYAKKETGTKLVYAYHFNPLMSIKAYTDYKEKCIRKINNPITKLLTSICLEIKRVWYNYQNTKKTREKYREYDIENIDAFVSLNKEYTSFFKKLFLAHHDNKFHTIANPITINNINELYEKENIVLFVGRLVSLKRLDRLIYIWWELYRKFPDWKLIVVGDGEHANEYRSIVQKLKLENIEFVGQKSSEEYFKRSKILCLTSSHEGLPMVLIEAQKYGCVPVAYNSFESATDIIQNRHNGLLITPFKQKEYIRSLEELMSNDRFREELAKNGISHIQKFNIEQIIKEWIALFENLQ